MTSANEYVSAVIFPVPNLDFNQSRREPKADPRAGNSNLLKLRIVRVVHVFCLVNQDPALVRDFLRICLPQIGIGWSIDSEQGVCPAKSLASFNVPG